MSSLVMSLALELVKRFAERKLTLAAAESCTAGLAAGFIAAVPGASSVFWGSFVSYSIEAKCKMLDIPKALIEEHGAVSSSVAQAMASAALDKSGASRAFSITGLAGPDGDGSETPVGTVWVGLADRAGSKAKSFLFSGSRNEIREAACAAAFKLLLERL